MVYCSLMTNPVEIKDIMTSQVVSVKDTDTLDVIADLFEKYDYDGLPVVDEDGKLAGIITAYDMVVQSSGMHLPTILDMMDKISINQADKNSIEEHFNKLRQVKAKEIMNTDPLTTRPDVPVDELAKEFAQHHKVNPIIVIDGNGRMVGVVSRYDIIKFFNEKYFNRILQATGHSDVLQSLSHAGVEEKVNSAVGDISKNFVLVGKKRPRAWKIAAIATFIAGFIVAMAFIVRIVRKSDEYGYNLKNLNRTIVLVDQSLAI